MSSELKLMLRKTMKLEFEHELLGNLKQEMDKIQKHLNHHDPQQLSLFTAKISELMQNTLKRIKEDIEEGLNENQEDGRLRYFVQFIFWKKLSKLRLGTLVHSTTQHADPALL